MRRVVFDLANATAAQLSGADSVVHGPGCLTWHSCYETTGSATSAYSLADGSTRNGVRLAYVTLQAGQSTRDSLPLHSLPFIESLHFAQVSGLTSGVLVAWVDHVCEVVLDHHHAIDALEGAAAAKALGW